MSASILDRLANGADTSEPVKPAAQPIVDGKGSIDVVAYDGNADPNSAAFLPWLWRRLVEDGVVSLYFPGAEQTGFAAFVKLFSSGTPILVVYKRNEAGEIIDVVGFATLEIMQFGQAMAAHAGFIFLKKFWDHHASGEAAQRIMQTWFKWEAPRIDVIIGIIAERNVLARRFLQRIGWAHSGNIPFIHQYNGEKSDASVWYVTREKFEKGVA